MEISAKTKRKLGASSVSIACFLTLAAAITYGAIKEPQGLDRYESSILLSAYFIYKNGRVISDELSTKYI